MGDSLFPAPAPWLDKDTSLPSYKDLTYPSLNFERCHKVTTNLCTAALATNVMSMKSNAISPRPSNYYVDMLQTNLTAQINQTMAVLNTNVTAQHDQTMAVLNEIRTKLDPPPGAMDVEANPGHADDTGPAWYVLKATEHLGNAEWRGKGVSIGFRKALIS